MASAELGRRERREAYESARPDVQALVPGGAKRILDLGCASGELGAALKRRQGAEVVGIELGEAYAGDARTRLDEVHQGDIDGVLAEQDLGRFDCLIAADVLEHLVDPWATLRRAGALVEPGGAVVVSLPNVRYLLTYYRLIVQGRWPREPSGFFDATHLRWFTPLDAQDLIEQAGFTVDATVPRFFFRGRMLALAERTGRTPLAPFLAGQYLFRGRR